MDFLRGDFERDYQVVIENTVKREGANFAGHYTLVSWGCGSPCQMSVVVDMKTGKVHNGQSSCYGYQFTVTSKVLQVNPAEYDNGWYKAERLCGPPKEYLWNGKSFSLSSQ